MPECFMKQRVLCSWSSGKDSAWGLHALRASGAVEVVGLLTTVNEHSGYVPMHETPEDLLDAQAEAIGLPLFKVRVPESASALAPWLVVVVVAAVRVTGPVAGATTLKV